jgi:hypothetical protein
MLQKMCDSLLAGGLVRGAGADDHLHRDDGGIHFFADNQPEAVMESGRLNGTRVEDRSGSDTREEACECAQKQEAGGVPSAQQ